MEREHLTQMLETERVGKKGGRNVSKCGLQVQDRRKLEREKEMKTHTDNEGKKHQCERKEKKKE